MNKNTTTLPFSFPEGEFTIKNLTESSGQPQPVVSMKVKDALANGIVKVLRKQGVQGKRGRPTTFYSKV